MTPGEARGWLGFYLDENLSHRLAALARAQGLDVTSAQELGRHGLSDEVQLAYAAADGRCIVTRDGDDFIAITDRLQRQALPHAGLLVVSWRVEKPNWGRFVAALAQFGRDHPWPMQPYEIAWLKRV